MRAIRPWLTKIHRWTGLALVAFLIVVGFTGALLPFQGNIQQWLAPKPASQIVRPPASGAAPLDWITLGEIAERRTGGLIGEVPLHREADEPATFSISAKPGQPAFAFDTLSLDPYSGRELARHRIGDDGPFLGRVMPFLYSLHTSLALGDWGAWLLGIAALAWTIDCFVGFYLTLPTGSIAWWRHWRQAWKMRLPPRNAFRFNFDLHRAAGLWLWPMLFVFAWSSVGMNLRPVFDPVMQTLFNYSPAAVAAAPSVSSQPILTWPDALKIARVDVAREGVRRGFTIERERALWIDRDGGAYTYVVRTSRDASSDGANSYFGIDGRSGHITKIELPTGEHAGATVDYWLGMLHEASVGGLPYRILVSIVGATILALSITGILIWLRKRSARRKRRLGQTANLPVAVEA